LVGRTAAPFRDFRPCLGAVTDLTIDARGAVPAPEMESTLMTHALAVLSGRYLDWGVISISVTNAGIIVAMVAVFVLALVVPFPKDRDRDSPGGRRS
jgi:hypothetical protein